MKRILKITQLSSLVFLNLFFISGCWNYREIDQLAIVAGAAIDKQDDKYLVSAEIVNVTGGKEAKVSPKVVTGIGDTIFDAIRNTIKISGKQLYWAHSEILIISQEIAREGVVEVIDLFARDPETRMSSNLLISKEKTAKEILEQQSITTEIQSSQINKMLMSQKGLSKAPVIAIYQFVNNLADNTRSAVLPAISNKKTQGKSETELFGSAVFKKDKLSGFLNGEDTKYFLFVLNKVKGGLLIQKEKLEGSDVKVSLEIFADKTYTKIKPVYSNGKLTMKLDVFVNVAIGELEGSKNYMNEPGRTKLQKAAEKSLEDNINRVIKKVQNEYNSDIFEFGRIVQDERPDVWKELEDDWEKIYKDLEVKVKAEIIIKDSSLLLKPIKIGS
ncbi:Ger(x)C family spore germination protein [Neobacillus sp. CF12]|uniref:Ger(x)C family spore germination protein n=1 Tax=Neobacillus sp. CF12 TaxID=3055864 RepID=UPI0025A18DD1|nr:Ger(x)C family spore germination protein [Neobacillus sp. CF12]MDM5327006.1 Ger(x)C family spore germination protein [Neobacillus sp. CF12]